MLSPNSQDLTLRLQETMHYILQHYETPPTENILLTATRYALSHNGKMLRGRMLLEVCRALAGTNEHALFAAAAVEYLHLGTLLHDDIIDQDELRRGVPAVWKQFSPDLALLSGDLLYFAAYQFLARSFADTSSPSTARALHLFSTACMDLCFGQALEEKLVGKLSDDYPHYHEDYLEIVRLKTSSLFRAALQMGTLLGGGSNEQIEAMGRFAEHLGVAFQMVDDLLPFTSSAQTIGKPVTSDIKNHRLTAPILYAFAAADEADRHTLYAVYRDGQFDEELINAHTLITEVLKHTDALHLTRVAAAQHRQQAVNELLCLPDNDARDFLRSIANQLV
ncbi:MAG TPA: polyprenyl synthetase family protein [Ktedonobacteraceae bacterium]|jgi:geranylgeranyl diphosphate synthase type I